MADIKDKKITEDDIRKIQYELKYLIEHIEYENMKLEELLTEFKCCKAKEFQRRQHLDELNFRHHDYKCRLEELKKQIPDFSEDTYNKYKEFIRVEDAVKSVEEYIHEVSCDKNFEDNLMKQIKKSEELIEKLKTELKEKTLLVQKTAKED